MATLHGEETGSSSCRITRWNLTLANIDELTTFTWAIRQALRDNGITGDDGEEIDHIELFVPSQKPGVDSKNFVLCPGKAYDRSPCGTGTSAKLACLYADGKLREGQMWKQESIVGSVFEGSIAVRDGKVYPSIKGSAFVNAEADLMLDPRDPFCMGIRGMSAVVHVGMTSPSWARELLARLVQTNLRGAACGWSSWIATRSEPAQPRLAWATSSSWTIPKRSLRLTRYSQQLVAGTAAASCRTTWSTNSVERSGSRPTKKKWQEVWRKRDYYGERGVTDRSAR